MATVRPKGRGYEIRVFCGRDINGKRLDRAKMWIPEDGMTKKQLARELERQKVLFEEEVKSGICPDDGITFYVFAQRWLEEYGKQNLAIKTYTRYEAYLKRINIAIGHKKLRELRPMHLNAFYNNLREDGINQKTGGKLAPKTILEHHRVISIILSTAVRWQLLENNVALRADTPKVPYREKAYLDEVQIKQMLHLLAAEPIQYRAMISLLVYTGLRRGELCGLEWKDIDYEEQTLHVVRTSQYIGNRQIHTKEPKTKSGIRDFSLSASACQLLREYQQWQHTQREMIGDRWQETDRLFTMWDGRPIHPDTITDWFAKFIKRSNLPYVTLHSLRHTNATLMIAEGTDICTVSRRLGHANTTTTLNVYSHALRSKDTEAASKLESVLCLAV